MLPPQIFTRRALARLLTLIAGCWLSCQPIRSSDCRGDEPYEKLSTGYGGEYYGTETDTEAYDAPGSYSSHPLVFADDGSYRQPMDVLFVDGNSALISTKLSGEIYEFSLSPPSVAVAYFEESCSWGQMLALAPGIVAIAENKREQVVILRRASGRWSPTCRLEAPGRARALAWDAENQTLYASGLWSQQLFRWKLQGRDACKETNWQSLATADLQMCGGEVLLLPKHELVLVTDAFGRNYRMLDRQTGRVVKRDRVYGHNITALASVRDGSMVLFPHQLLSETAQSVRSEITWGGVMSNNLRWLHVDRMRHQTGQEIFKQGRFYPLGSTGNGSGDPTALAISSTGLLAITLGGTNRVAIGREDDYYFRQVDVGLHPVACAFTKDESQLIVVNQFSDSLSLIDLATDQVQQISLGPIRAPTQIERGEQAFFNSKLSHDGWMSCHSCHSHGHTNGQLNDNLTDHSFGTPKRVLSLLGQSQTAPYSWTASLPDLESQITHSIRSTMASDRKVSLATVDDIAAYIRSLPPPPSRVVARQSVAAREQSHAPYHVDSPMTASPLANTGKFARGAALFRELGCNACHGGKWYTSAENYDVDLADQNNHRLFNPPSLVSISQRQDVLLHDGRATSLRDLLENHHHELSRELSKSEVNRLVAYLEQL